MSGTQGAYRVVGIPGPGLALVAVPGKTKPLLFSQLRRPYVAGRANRGTSRASLRCAICGTPIGWMRYYRYPIGGPHDRTRICPDCVEARR